MKYRWLVGLSSLVLGLAGCTNVVPGTMHAAPGLKPRPLLNETVKEVLLDDAALAAMLGQPFKVDSDFPPRYGGRDKLPRSYGPASPPSCVGVVTQMEKGSYESAPVQDIARQVWWHATDSVKVISVTEGVVTFPAVTDASALFDQFTTQWKKCAGTSVQLSGSTLSFVDTISNVRVADSVLAADISEQASLSDATPMPMARAIGVRANCLVEVEIAFFSTDNSSDQGTATLSSSAIQIARAVMDKISALV